VTDNLQYTHPDVTKRKYDEELKDFVKISELWRKKGVFLISETHPTIEFLFALPKLKPSAISFAVRIDFTNYDVEPPSLKFICPFTGKFLTKKEVGMKFIQAKVPEVIQPGLPVQIQQQDLLQGSENEIPFFCIPGIKEYHDHPAHTGDAWLLYRKRGEGRLGFILDQLYSYSTPTVKSYGINYVIGFNQQIEFPSK